MVTERQYHKKCIQGVLQLKVHQGSVSIKSTARECHNLSTLGSVTIKSTTRDRHNEKYCQGVQITEVQQESMTTRKCNMQMYFNSLSQLKTLQGSITIEKTDRTMNRAAR